MESLVNPRRGDYHVHLRRCKSHRHEASVPGTARRSRDARLRAADGDRHAGLRRDPAALLGSRVLGRDHRDPVRATAAPAGTPDGQQDLGCTRHLGHHPADRDAAADPDRGHLGARGLGRLRPHEVGRTQLRPLLPGDRQRAAAVVHPTAGPLRDRQLR